MSVYTLIKSLTVDGTERTAGAVVELNDAQAKWLHDLGIINMGGNVNGLPVPALLKPPVPLRRRSFRCCGW